MCDCDGNHCITYGEAIRKARKDHKCCECYRVIKAGERYQYVSGIWSDTGFDDFKTCAHCHAMRAYFDDLAPKDECGLCLSSMQEEVLERLRYEMESMGSYPARLYYSCCHKWTYRRGPRKGQLMPVPKITEPIEA